MPANVSDARVAAFAAGHEVPTDNGAFFRLFNELVGCAYLNFV